ncbi:MAG TPA: hypothetical protein EYG82_05765 [Sulfurovum sp.]|nr:hypothetical protein [Sulfurovum sp.]
MVNTLVYIPRDKPALTMFGKKVWFAKDDLVKFGRKYCLLCDKEALVDYDICVDAVVKIKKEIQSYTKEHKDFSEFSDKFVKIIDFSLNENSITTYKELPNGIL